MPLTDRAVRNARPADKPIRLFDERGLYLEVAPSGGKWWRFKYRFAGRRSGFHSVRTQTFRWRRLARGETMPQVAGRWN